MSNYSFNTPNVVSAGNVVEMLPDLLHVVKGIHKKMPGLEYRVLSSTKVAVWRGDDPVGSLRFEYFGRGGKHRWAVGAFGIYNARPLFRAERNEEVTSTASKAVQIAVEHFRPKPAADVLSDYCSDTDNLIRTKKYAVESKIDKMLKDIQSEREMAGKLAGINYDRLSYAMHSVFQEALLSNDPNFLRTYISRFINIDEYLDWQRIAAGYRSMNSNRGVYVTILRSGRLRMYDATLWDSGDIRRPWLESYEKVHEFASYETLPSPLQGPIAMLQISEGEPMIGTGAKVNPTLYFIQEEAINYDAGGES